MGGGRAVPQGKHRKMVLEAPGETWRQPRWGMCCLSLPLCLQLTLSHTCTQALCSQSSLGALCPSWSPGLEEEHPMLSSSQTTRAPLGVPWAMSVCPRLVDLLVTPWSSLTCCSQPVSFFSLFLFCFFPNQTLLLHNVWNFMGISRPVHWSLSAL